MSDPNVRELAEQPEKKPAPDHSPWPENDSAPRPDGSVLIKVRNFDLPKRPADGWHS